MISTLTPNYRRFHPYRRTLHQDADYPSLKQFDRRNVVVGDSSRFLEAVAKLPPLAEHLQPLRLQQQHEQQQKDRKDTAHINVVECEHELVVRKQGRITWPRGYLYFVLMVIVVLVALRPCGCRV
ncbi:hypothetical protein VKT23_009127 [Stygiomarasmius scandens]|uniref:Uncharacterized protein n=1 Tax=Marasmiellus scandens TaxID=2682957 RepID=A0ABR1JEI7_9AGAR